MVGLGMLIATLGALSLYARVKGRLYDSRLLHRFALAIGPSGLVAVLAGWVATEVGRQPWTIYGLMRTTDPASPLAAPAVAASLVAFVLIYFSVFGAGIVYILKLMGKPPESHESPLPNMPVRFAGTTLRWQRPSVRHWHLDERHAMNFDLTVVRALIIVFALFVYVAMDGFDLGIGLLFQC